MLNKEESVKNFVKTLTLLVRVKNLIKDKFFAAKFTEKIGNFTLEYIHWQSGNNKIKFMTADEIIELIGDMIYLNFLKESLLLLAVRKNLLILKLDFIKSLKKSDIKQEPLNEFSGFQVKKEKIEIQRKIIKPNPTSQKIFEFIRAYPQSRTKDIIQEFNALSDRTVKRNLGTLLKSGMIRKKVENKAVYYFPADPML